jgi:hypothetical protein
VNLTILPRRDLEENWTLKNPILREKEFAVSVDKDIIKYKLGDGKSCYTDLPFTNLFDALMLGIIYSPAKATVQYHTVKLRLLDEKFIDYLNENYKLN